MLVVALARAAVALRVPRRPSAAARRRRHAAPRRAPARASLDPPVERDRRLSRRMASPCPHAAHPDDRRRMACGGSSPRHCWPSSSAMDRAADARAVRLRGRRRRRGAVLARRDRGGHPAERRSVASGRRRYRRSAAVDGAPHRRAAAPPAAAGARRSAMPDGRSESRCRPWSSGLHTARVGDAVDLAHQPAIVHAAHARRRRRPPVARVPRWHDRLPVAALGRGHRRGARSRHARRSINTGIPALGAGQADRVPRRRGRFLVNVPAATAMAWASRCR